MIQKLTKLDLNLLSTFLVVYQTQNLKLASKVLSCTAPAVSIKLSKLKDQLGQTLFVKIPTGLEPTPFADELYISVEPLLNQLEESVLNLSEFDPHQMQGTVKISMGRHILPWLSPRLYMDLSKVAPNSSLLSDYFSPNTLEALKKGDIDLGVEYYIQDIPKDLIEIPIGKQSLCFVVRENHPCKLAKASLQELIEYDFSFVSHSIEPYGLGGELVKDLIRKNIKVNMKFSSPSFAAVLEAVKTSDLICPIPESLFDKDPSGLRKIQVKDVSLLRDNPVNIYLHKKNRNSKKHLWFIDKIHEEFAQVL